MADYCINLAKSVTSTPEQRRSFYNRMILYLALCSAGMVYVAYLASFNVMEAYRAGRYRRNTVRAVSSISSFGKDFYKNPEKAYKELSRYASDLTALKSAFGQRTHFLPVLNKLFADFPENVTVETLNASAEEDAISFILVGSGKSIKAQQELWRKDAELGGLVRSIKQVKSEQRTVNGLSISTIEFECILK